MPEYSKRRRITGVPVAVYNRQFAIDLPRGLSILQALEAGQVAQIKRVAEDNGGMPDQPAQQQVQREGDLLVIPIRGTLTQHEDVCTSFMGGTSYEWIDQQLQRAVSEGWPAVLFDISSPGGMVDGCFDLADKVYRLRDQGIITGALARDLACSAAYALGSSADRLWATQTGDVGSIGVYQLHIDMSKAIADAGEVWTAIYAGEDKVLGAYWQELSKDALEYLQASVNHTYQLFLGKVARNRGLAMEKVRDTRARSFPAPVAQQLGLIDGTMYFEQAIEEMSREIARRRRPGMVGASAQKSPSRKAQVETLRRGAAVARSAIAKL